MRLRTNLLVFVACALIAVSLAAQAPPEPNGPVTAGAMGKGAFTMHLENNMDAAPVKGVPFCANISTEHTQSFADGNRIHGSDSSTLCRDSEGRTRREAGLNLLGAGPEKSAAKLVTIVDPVAGVRYMLDPENKTAHRMSLSAPGPGAPPDLSKHVMVFRSAGSQEGGGGSTDFFYQKAGPDHEAAGTTENLGDQTINGIHATGTRMTHTIPAGQMGNEKPIVVTSERWYSQDLKATVMTKHDDPWAGELKTEFTSVNTAEPDASLFTVPGDYKIVDDKDGPIMMHRFVGPPPQ
ncbi:MAG TPA: hypothetical protein VKB77_17370 [Terriglobales bacterium]|nr:hypothetical protein [Terriglobales bacterium]